MSNATLPNIKGFTASQADLTITLDRSDLDRIMMGTPDFEVFPSTLNARPTPATTKPFQMVLQPASALAE